MMMTIIFNRTKWIGVQVEPSEIISLLVETNDERGDDPADVVVSIVLIVDDCLVVAVGFAVWVVVIADGLVVPHVRTVVESVVVVVVVVGSEKKTFDWIENTCKSNNRMVNQ